MNILTYLSWVRKLWNTVVEIVKLIEETIPDDGAGKEKLAAFDVMLKAALEKADDVDESFDKLQPVAHDIVAAVVAPHSYQCRFYSSPNTVVEYLDNPNRWPSTIGVIEEGTLIKCTMIRKTGTWLWSESVHVWGEILNGPHKGVVAKLVDISSYIENGKYSPDERFLIEIE